VKAVATDADSTILSGKKLTIEGELDVTDATVTGLTAAKVNAVATNADSTILSGKKLTIEGTLDVSNATVEGSTIPDDSIDTEKLKDNAVTKVKIDFSNITANDVKAVPIIGTIDKFWSMTGNFAGPLCSFQNEAKGNIAGFGILSQVGSKTIPVLPSAVIAGVSQKNGVHGVYGEAPTGAYALYGAGNAFISGTLTTKNGICPGHIADRFINGSSQTLRTGDVVKLKGDYVIRFEGQNNKIPIAEVTLADRENDPRIIGIVDGKAIPGPEDPDFGVSPDDPPAIESGGELFVVTLGTFAHCKVDATETAIEVGDLLTSSDRPGYAKKATDPKIGCTIGKALSPMPEGEGYIAIFVSIQ